MNPREEGSYAGYRALMLLLFGPSGQPPAWREAAACAGTDTEVFFNPEGTEQAVSICAGCPVLAECRADHLAWESATRARRFYTAGVVGGQSAATRKHGYYPRTTNPTTTHSTTTKDVA